MNPVQVRMFIEQVLLLPSIPLAARYVQSNANYIDETFFQVLGAMIQKEQGRSQASPALFIPNMPTDLNEELGKGTRE